MSSIGATIQAQFQDMMKRFSRNFQEEGGRVTSLSIKQKAQHVVLTGMALFIGLLVGVTDRFLVMIAP